MTEDWLTATTVNTLLLCLAWITRLARYPVGVGVADDGAIRLDINLAGRVVLAGLIAGKPAPTGSCVGAGSCGWPGTLWESALPTMGSSASTSILLIRLFLPASSLAMPAPTDFLYLAWITRLARDPVGVGVADDGAICLDINLADQVVLAGLIAGKLPQRRALPLDLFSPLTARPVPPPRPRHCPGRTPPVPR